VLENAVKHPRPHASGKNAEHREGQIPAYVAVVPLSELKKRFLVATQRISRLVKPISALF
jgi:hypothetical protein